MHFGSLLKNLFKFKSTITKNSTMATSSNSQKSVLLFLHGLGDSGHSWQMGLGQAFKMFSGNPNITIQCPTAPNQPVTINMGLRCNSWFDITSLDMSKEEASSSIAHACTKIHAKIEELEKDGFPSEKIMLGGFSQGGALSLYSSLKYPKKLAGVVCLSCWLPLHKEFPSAVSPANKDLPILQCHGDADEIVDVRWAKATNEVLKKSVNNEKLQFKIFPNLGHGECPEEMKTVIEFINTCLP